jgi:hypothetical protein
MEGSCSTGQSPQRAAVPVKEEEEDKLKTPALWAAVGIQTATSLTGLLNSNTTQ